MSHKADIGILGGGQLGRMSIHAAQRMGLRCVSLDAGEDTPAAQVAPAIQGQLSDPEAIGKLLSACDFATLENEFIPADALRNGMARAGFDPERLTPRIDTLALVQDKLAQRQAYAKAGVPSPRAVVVEDGIDLPFPFVLKARFGGYDGKGTRYAKNSEEFEALRSVWSQPHALQPDQPGWLAEEFVPFRRELAVMVYRTPTFTGAYPTMETIQTNHVCDLVFPADVDASEIAIAAVESVNGLGLFGVELFEREDGAILVNEMAPRPHNSGHYTLDWGDVSQFEMHARLTMGFPIPHTLSGGPVCMANLLAPRAGSFSVPTAVARALKVPGTHVHWYGKTLREGRKVGHINAVGDDIRTNAVESRRLFWDM